LNRFETVEPKHSQYRDWGFPKEKHGYRVQHYRVYSVREGKR
jgi:hypothetical protein